MPTLTGKRTINTAAYNFHAACNLLELAETKQEGQFYWSLASIVFSAFSYEAFLNIVGSTVLSSDQWCAIDRAGWRRKHLTLCSALGLSCEPQTQPMSTLIKLFEFRNSVAHGREEEVEINGITVADLSPLTLADATSGALERVCTLEFARQAVEDVRKCAMSIREAQGEPVYGPNPFGSPSVGGYHAEA